MRRPARRTSRPGVPDIDELIRLGMEKLSELDEEARAALEEGDRRAYLSTMRVFAIFLKTNAGLLLTRRKLKGSGPGRLDLARLLSGVKKLAIGLVWRRRKKIA